MRKVLLLISVSMLVFACNKQDFESDLEPPQSSILPTHKISVDSLKRQAEGLVAIFGESTTKSRTVRVAGVLPMSNILYTKGVTKSAAVDVTLPQAYVINYADGGGFAILADDNRLSTNVLAYSESGNVDETTDNPGLLFYMSMANDYLAAEGARINFIPNLSMTVNYEPNKSVKPYNWGVESRQVCQWTYMHGMEVKRINKLLSVNWGQNYPYNILTPIANGQNCPTGCGPTAIVQVMSHYNHPSSITYFVDGKTYLINWTRAKQGDIIGGNIHYLMRDCGQKANAVYAPDITNTLQKNISSALANYGYSSISYDGLVSESIVSSIDHNYLVLISGRNTKNRDHLWVVDGYIVVKTESIRATDYVEYENNDIYKPYQVGQKVNQVQELFTDTYMHVNWGWNGENNGFFQTFTTKNAYAFDGSSNPTDFDFQTINLITYGIRLIEFNRTDNP